MITMLRVVNLTLSNLLLPVAIFIFATGFFPYKPLIPGLATYQHTSYGEHVPDPPFDKLVFMVVDALRSDFVFGHGSGFTFTQSLIVNGSALPFTAHATAPTVTMPRLKAITTGSIPSFLDMILNFAESDKSSSLANQDTWLAQMKAKESGRLVMYGDDTWLKLFPDTFSRSDGTSSFFVSDFTEVDNNVTRHIPEELGQADWSVMVMHYLGMDHIGHKSGSKSINMLPKEKEMDGIVQHIFEAMIKEVHLHSTLLVLCGDHGMTDGGNHGGSAPGETSPALVFISPKLQLLGEQKDCPTVPHKDLEFYETVEQSDIAPSLAGLLGFPVPLNNLGVFIPGLLKLWDKDMDRLQLLLRNALQMLDIAKATFPGAAYDDPSLPQDCNDKYSTTQELICAWRAVGRSIDMAPDVVEQKLLEFCMLAQQSLSSTASNYNITRMYAGLALTLLITATCTIASWECLSLARSSSGRFFAGTAIMYSAMMLASSYVEEEHQFWYWATAAWLMVHLSSSAQRLQAIPLTSASCMLVLLRLMRRWRQSGQKFQGSPDIAAAIEQHSPFLLWPLVLLTLQTIFTDLVSKTFKPLNLSTTTSRFAAALLCINCLLFKLAFTNQQEPELLNPLPDDIKQYFSLLDPLPLARLQFLWLFVASLYCISAKARLPTTAASRRPSTSTSRLLHPLLTLLLVTQSRLSNIPLSLLSLSLLHFRNLLPQITQSPSASSLTSLLLAHTAFHASGGTNGISTIDLSSAYNGIAEYRPGLVGLLLVLGNWTGAVFWALAPSSPGTESGSPPSTSRRDEPREETLERRKGEKRRGKAMLLAGREETAPANGATPKKGSEEGNWSMREMERWREEVEILTLWTAVEVAGVMLACIVHRQHLFVWTVFSPKYLYMAAWVVCWHLGCNVFLRGLLCWAA